MVGYRVNENSILLTKWTNSLCCAADERQRLISSSSPPRFMPSVGDASRLNNIHTESIEIGLRDPNFQFRKDYSKSKLRFCGDTNSIRPNIKDAETANETVLILLFRHGDRDNHGIVLGGGNRNPLKMGEFKSATKALKMSITLITTSCYSGGWTCNPELNVSAMTAAGNENVSLSWRFSGSTGRACGFMFTTALV